MWVAPFVTIAGVIDAGIFATLGPATAKAGAGILLAIGIAGVVALASGVSGVELGEVFPTSGGPFIWARRFDMRILSFATGTCYLAKAAIALSVNAIVLGAYPQAIVPGLPVHAVAGAIVVAVTVLNAFGVKLTARVLVVLTAILVGVLALYGAASAPAVDLARLRPRLDKGAGGLLSGAGAFFFTFAGFQRIATIASRVEKPKKTIPIATFVGFAVSAVIFVAIAAVTLGVLGPGRMGGDPMPLLAAARASASRWLPAVVVAAAMLAALGALADGVMGTAGVAREMSVEKELPAWLGARQKHPRNAVLVFGGLTAALALSMNLRPLLAVANVFTLVWYGATNFVALSLDRKERIATRPVSLFALAGCLALLATLPVWAIGAALGFLGVSVALRQWLKSRG